MEQAYIVVNIEILDQRISTSRYRLIERDLSRVVESGQVDSVRRRARHGERARLRCVAVVVVESSEATDWMLMQSMFEMWSS